VNAFGHRYQADQRNALIQAWGDWLPRVIDGSHIETLTFGGRPSPEHALIEFRKHVQDLERRSGQSVRAFVVVEHTFMGVVHLHAFLELATLDDSQIVESWEWRAKKKKVIPMRIPTLEPKSDIQLEAEKRQNVLDSKRRYRQKRWHRGNAKVEAYDPERGWTHYMMKNVSGSIIDYQFIRCDSRSPACTQREQSEPAAPDHAFGSVFGSVP
jgi:hypothetical protein